MYIIELFFKLKNDYKKGILQEKMRNFLNSFSKKEENDTKEVEKCSHLYVPIDSTGRILACSKCGKIYKLKKGEVNPFK